LLAFVDNFNLFMFILFTLMYFYQGVYTLVALISHFAVKPSETAAKQHKFAVLIAARNEQAVIGELIKSIKNQNYPRKLIDVFVVADNCTDATATVARNAGAIVYERFNTDLKGKGYALNYMIHRIEEEYGERGYEGFFVFDADNVLDENYVAEMNKKFDKGYKVLTSYRNSKNYAQNWITAGYALWFLHEAKYLNNPRMILKTSCAISGTGFLLHRDIIKRNGGWVHYLLTEDIEFSISEVIKGEVIGYCGTAMLYDEQPSTFEQSWHQRLRWAKGFYQVFGRYGAKLFKGLAVNKSNAFSCYDMLMNIMPALLISITSIVMNVIFAFIGLQSNILGPYILESALSAIMATATIYYIVLFSIGLLTTLTEWNNIYCSASKKLFYLFTFPFFIFTYLPISIVALFKKVEWRPIAHNCVVSVDDVRQSAEAAALSKQAEVSFQRQWTNLK